MVKKARSSKKKAAQAGGKKRTSRRAAVRYQTSGSLSVGRVTRFALKWGAVASIWGAVILGGVVIFYAHDLPSIDDALAATRRPTVVLLDSRDREFAISGDVSGDAVRVANLPAHLPQAITATEDRRYYGHFGIDVIGIGRALVTNLRAGRIVQGGSTITQQAAKNLFLTPERTVKRKIQEILLALWLEKSFTKDQILTIYLNRVYLGSGTYGVEAAAQKYFGRAAHTLTLHQSAIIAGLLKAPSRLNPLHNPQGALKRSRVVLSNMVAAGHISEKSADRARKSPLRFSFRKARTRQSRYFVDWIMEQLPGFIGLGAGDVVVRTTLDTEIQRRAESHLQAALKRHGTSLNISQGAALVLAPNGAVRALVGGRNYDKSQYNRAVQARRQPGSVFKPFVYLAGLEAGLRPASQFQDKPLKIGKWGPRNYRDKYRGTVLLAEGLGYSSNSVAVQVAQKAGVASVLATAQRLGVSSSLRADLSTALGASEVSLMDLTTGYAPFANGGRGVFAYGIRDIRDNKGKILFRRSGSGTGQVVRPSHVRMMNEMLSGVLLWGTGKSARLGRPAAGKTGTSQAFRDAWFIGYTPDYVAGIWLGNDAGQPMKRVTGGGVPAHIWRSLMIDIHKGLPEKALPGGGQPFKPYQPAPPPVVRPRTFWNKLFRTLGGG